MIAILERPLRDAAGDPPASPDRNRPDRGH
jgi:hypothetical protein